MSKAKIHSMTTGTVVWLVIVSIAAGYFLGLWQQAAQYHRRMLIEASENSFLKD